MTTERQISANRANAKRSTGPKTEDGRLKVSRNSYRHGLSCPAVLNQAEVLELDAIAKSIFDSQPSRRQYECARDLVLAQVELFRIRKVRDELLKSIVVCQDENQIRRLVALDRYERFAATKRRRAVTRLSSFCKDYIE